MSYRNARILAAAKDVPACMDCGRANDGTVVAAHSNQGRDGKGMGIKAADYRVAYLCQASHRSIDQGGESREVRQGRWEAAHRRTIGWLFDSGKVAVK